MNKTTTIFRSVATCAWNLSLHLNVYTHWALQINHIIVDYNHRWFKCLLLIPTDSNIWRCRCLIPNALAVWINSIHFEHSDERRVYCAVLLCYLIEKLKRRPTFDSNWLWQFEVCAFCVLETKKLDELHGILLWNWNYIEFERKRAIQIACVKWETCNYLWEWKKFVYVTSVSISFYPKSDYASVN